MKKLIALIDARNKEFYRDRTAMVWTLLFPMIVLLGFTYGYSGRQEPILKIALSPSSAIQSPVIRHLQKSPGLEIREDDDGAVPLRKIQRYEADLAILVEGTRYFYAANPDSDRGKLASQLLAEAVAHQPEPRPSLEGRTVEGRRIRYSDWVLPGLLAMNLMFGSMFGVGYVIVRYRKNGVLKRLRATPLSAFQFLTAQVISRMALMVVTSFIVLGGAMILIGFKPQGSWLDLIVVLTVGSAAMISVGLLVAARISNEEVADGVLNLMTWPMIFLSGVWFSLDGASPWVVFLSKLMPLKHVVDGLRAVLVDGASLTQLYPQMGVLLVLSVLFIAIGSVIFKWR